MSDQAEVLERFNQTIVHRDGRYEVGFPWRQQINLPTNYYLCLRRFKLLVRRLQRENLVGEYDDVIQQQLQRGFIEEVRHTAHSDGIVHYIAHHPVIRRDRATTKLRIVYDASAQQSASDPSLNDSLFSGPNLIRDLMNILLRMRTYKVAVTADIEKAFLQVSLRPEDRDATRFFWLKNVHEAGSIKENIMTYRFRRVPFGATCSPFLLAATIRYHLENSPHDEAKALIPCFYVDNLVSGAQNVDMALQFYADAKRTMAQAGMNLRELSSNSKQFLERIPAVDRTNDQIVKVLGLQWNTSNDVLFIKPVMEMATTTIITKRTVLQTIAKIFDPHGYVSPVVIRTKVMIQKLWKEKVPWDEELSEQDKTQWKITNKDLSRIGDIEIPRYTAVNYQQDLHVFVDASTKAYAAVTYLIQRNTEQQQPFARLILCKSSVAPIRSHTLPQLELMASLLGARLAKFVRDTIYQHVKTVIIWTDSQIVLHWINSGNNSRLFVKNRVSEIKRYNFNFCYCPTKDNPADLPTRGCDVNSLKESSLWWFGPKWLLEPQDAWPTFSYNNLVKEEKHQCQKEHRVEASPHIDAVVANLTSTIMEPPFGMDLIRFNSLGKVLRCTGYCLRFVKYTRKEMHDKGPISAEEYQTAKVHWIKFVQARHFGNEMKLLAQNRSSPLTRQHRMNLEDQILKCGGRIKNALAVEANDSLILLPKDDRFTQLIIRDCHERLLHQGVQHTLAALRQTFWIPSGRQQVRKLLYRCQVCRIWEGGHYQAPPAPPLPSMRLTEAVPFSFVGCDFAGPLHVRSSKTTTKAYICIFTCAVTRSVHLELVPDLTTESFISCMRRFIARRGTPKEILSDNAKTFKLAKDVLDRLWHNVVISDEVQSYAAKEGIRWKFNIERAP